MQIELIEHSINTYLGQIQNGSSLEFDKQQWALVRTGTTANCNLTKDRTRVDFTILIKTRSEKAYLHWLKENLFEQHPAEFTELQILTETKYSRISFVHAQTDLKVSLNVNNITGIFNSKLIGYFNLVDIRFHKLSILLIRWHKDFLHFKEQQFVFPSYVKTQHIINVYALQLMLATWMQHIG